MAEIIQYASGMSNAFFIKGDKGVIAVDTGDLVGKDVALKHFEDAGIDPEDVRVIIITHNHPDHVRNINALVELTNASVLMHESEADSLINGEPPHIGPRTEFGRKLIEMFSKMDMPKEEPTKCDVDIIMQQNKMSLISLGLDGYLLHTPGHSRGSISVVLDDGRAIVGDAFSANGTETVGMMPFFGDPELPFEMAEKSIQRLLDQGVQTFYSGHGGPYTREYVQEKLDEERNSVK